MFWEPEIEKHFTLIVSAANNEKSISGMMCTNLTRADAFL